MSKKKGKINGINGIVGGVNLSDLYIFFDSLNSGPKYNYLSNKQDPYREIRDYGAKGADKQKKNLYSAAVSTEASIANSFSAPDAIMKANAYIGAISVSERAKEMNLLRTFFGNLSKTHGNEHLTNLYNKLEAIYSRGLNNMNSINEFYSIAQELMTVAREGQEMAKKTMAELRAARNKLNAIRSNTQIAINRTGHIIKNGKSATSLTIDGASEDRNNAYATNYIFNSYSNAKGYVEQYSRYYDDKKKNAPKNVRRGQAFNSHLYSIITQKITTSDTFYTLCERAAAQSITQNGYINPNVIQAVLNNSASLLMLEAERELYKNTKVLRDITKLYQIEEKYKSKDKRTKEYKEAMSRAYERLEKDVDAALEEMNRQENSITSMLNKGKFSQIEGIMADAEKLLGVKQGRLTSDKIKEADRSLEDFSKKLENIRADFKSRAQNLIKAKENKSSNLSQLAVDTFGARQTASVFQEKLFNGIQPKFSVSSSSNQQGYYAELANMLVSMLSGSGGAALPAVARSSRSAGGAAATDTISVMVTYSGGRYAHEERTDKHNNARGDSKIKIQHEVMDTTKKIADLISQANLNTERSGRKLTQERLRAINDLDKEMKKYEEQLAQLSADFEIAGNIFVFHDSVKNYQSVAQGGRTTSINKGKTSNSNFSGFHGRSGNLFNMLELLGSGNSGMASMEEIKFFIMNIHLIDNGKTLLENYIAKFAMLLMFDDVQQIQQDALNNLASQYSTVQNIHMFPINGLYIPLSMFLTYMSQQVEEVSKIMNMQSRNANGMVKVDIGGIGSALANAQSVEYGANAAAFPRTAYNNTVVPKGSRNPGAYYQAWGEAANSASEDYTMSITFLKSFYNWLDMSIGL